MLEYLPLFRSRGLPWLPPLATTEEGPPSLPWKLGLRLSLPLLLAHFLGFLLSASLLLVLPPRFRSISVVTGLCICLLAMSWAYLRLRRLRPAAMPSPVLRVSDAFFGLRLLLTTLGLGLGVFYGNYLFGLPLFLLLFLLYLCLAGLQALLTVLDGEILSYLIFGGLTTAVSVISFSAFSLLFSALGWSRGQEDWVGVKLASFIVTILFAYFTNRRWVFRSRGPILPELFCFICARLGTSLLLEGGGLFVLVTLLHFEKNKSNLVLSLLVVLANYLLSKRSVFRNSRDGGQYPYVDL